VAITVTCPTCGATLKTTDSAAGKKAKCPKCQGPVVVPQLATDPAPVVDAEPKPADDLWDGFDQEAELAKSAASADAGGTRMPCPACGEMILADAAKCRFCGEYFDADLAKAEKKLKGNQEEKLTVGEWCLAIICSNIGCIMGIVWMIQGKPKGKKLLLASLAATGVWVVIQLLIAAAEQGAR
jgi:predicted RNA-binding Zn-ribbon protein involved in translation (DUF1610 family)